MMNTKEIYLVDEQGKIRKVNVGVLDYSISFDTYGGVERSLSLRIVGDPKVINKLPNELTTEELLDELVKRSK